MKKPWGTPKFFQPQGPDHYHNPVGGPPGYPVQGRLAASPQTPPTPSSWRLIDGLSQWVALFQRWITKARYGDMHQEVDKRFRETKLCQEGDMKVVRRKHLPSGPGSCSLEFSSTSGLLRTSFCNGARSASRRRGKAHHRGSILLRAWQAVKSQEADSTASVFAATNLVSQINKVWVVLLSWNNPPTMKMKQYMEGISEYPPGLGFPRK